jgi:hypothetical protein
MVWAPVTCTATAPALPPTPPNPPTPMSSASPSASFAPYETPPLTLTAPFPPPPPMLCATRPLEPSVVLTEAAAGTVTDPVVWFVMTPPVSVRGTALIVPLY